MNRITWEEDQVSPRAAHDEVVRLATERADPARRVSVRTRLVDSSIPDRVPAFSFFLVDDLGFVWVRPYEARRDAFALGGKLYWDSPPGGLWMVFTPGGERLDSIEMPAGLEPYEITSDAVVGIRRDELGVEYVDVHRLTRR